MEIVGYAIAAVAIVLFAIGGLSVARDAARKAQGDK